MYIKYTMTTARIKKETKGRIYKLDCAKMNMSMDAVINYLIDYYIKNTKKIKRR